MKAPNNDINSISPRANAKLVSVGERRFLVGGMTADKVTSDMFELKIHHIDGEHKAEWKPLKFKNNCFHPRNSFGACGSKTHLYIWGGLQTNGIEQKCLSDLIEVDVEKGQMRPIKLVQNIKIHSPAMMFDHDTNTIMAFGGTDQTSSMEGILHTLKLDEEKTQFQWRRARLDSEYHKGFLWQHTAHLSNKSYFTGAQGKFITTIGGCRYPYSPYNSIVEFDLNQEKMTNSVFMKNGLVSHDSVAEQDKIVIFGGANGGGFNSQIVVLEKGKVSYREGHCAVGCCCCGDEECWVVVGGVCGPQSLNRVIIYPK